MVETYRLIKGPRLNFSIMSRKAKRSVVTQNYPYVVRVVAGAGDVDDMHQFHVRNGIAEDTCGIKPLMTATCAGDLKNLRMQNFSLLSLAANSCPHCRRVI